MVKEYDEDRFVLLLGKVVRLEVRDDVLTPDGSLDVDKARPLLMTGSKKEMHYSTLKDIAQTDAFGAMFPDGRDPLANGPKNL